MRLLRGMNERPANSRGAPLPARSNGDGGIASRVLREPEPADWVVPLGAQDGE